MDLSSVYQFAYKNKIVTLILLLFSLDSESKERVILLENPVESFQIRISIIRNAQKTLDIATYEYGNDESASQVLHEIIKAAERGVKIRIVVDAMRNFIPKELSAYMVSKGIRIKVFNKFKLSKSFDNVVRMHAKITVRDRLSYIVGGRNIVNSYFYIGEQKNFRDREIYITGFSGNKAVEKFEDLWFSSLMDEIDHEKVYSEKASLKIVKEYFDGLDVFPFLSDDDLTKVLSKQKSFQVASIEIIIDKPHSYKFTQKYTTSYIVDKINTSRKEILIESPYVILNKEVYLSLHNAIRRGVKVQIITNSLNTSDSYLVLPVYFKERGQLQDEGFEIFEFQSEDQYLHTKMFIFDRKEILIGSYNLDMLSAGINTEIMISVKDVHVVNASLFHYNTTLTKSTKAPNEFYRPTLLEGNVTLETIKKYSIVKLLEYTIAPFLRDYL